MFCSDNKTLAVGNTLWDARTGQRIGGLEGPGLARLATPDGRYLVGGYENTVCVWDWRTRRRIHALNGHGVSPLAVSADGKYLGSLNCVWDLHSGKELQAPDRDSRTFYSSAVAFSPDGRTLYRNIKDFVGAYKAPFQGVYDHRQIDLGVTDLRTFSFDGSKIASVKSALVSGGRDMIRVFDVPGGNALAELTIPGKGPLEVTAMAFSANGRYLASGEAPPRDADPEGLKPLAQHDPPFIVRIWDLQAKQPVTEFHGHAGRIRDLAFSTDGRLLASASADGSVLIWDARTRAPAGSAATR